MISELSRSPFIPYNFGGAPAHGRALPPPLPALLTGGVALHSGALKPLTRGLLQRWGDGWLAQKPAIEMFCISAAASSFVAASQRMSASAHVLVLPVTSARMLPDEDDSFNQLVSPCA